MQTDGATQDCTEAASLPAISRANALWLRAGDIVLGSVLLLVCLPALTLACAALLSERAGPVFTCRERLTRDGRLVGLLMLRTARDTAFGPRLTPVGAFLRAGRIDHLPMLFNVLKGDLSLVGTAFADGARFAFRER